MIAEPNDRAKREIVQELLRNIYALQSLGKPPRPEDYDVSEFTEAAFMALDRYQVEGHCIFALRFLDELNREARRAEAASGSARTERMRRSERAQAWGVGSDPERFVWGSFG